jgi:xanthine/uracil permease
METLASFFSGFDWTSPTFLPICIAIAAGLLARLRVITTRNYKAACIAIAFCVGVGYAIDRSRSSTLPLESQFPALVLYTIAISAMCWIWLYIVVHGQFRQPESEANDKSNTKSA